MKRETQWLMFLFVSLMTVLSSDAAQAPSRSGVVQRPHGKSFDLSLLTEHVKRERTRSISPQNGIALPTRQIRSAASSPAGGGCGVDSPD